MTTRIKLRRDTAANWTTNDPVLALGEAGYDTTNNELRVGDGTTVWSGLESIGGTGNKITAEKTYSDNYSDGSEHTFAYTTGSIAVQIGNDDGFDLNDLLSRWAEYFSGNLAYPYNYSNINLVINPNTDDLASTVTNVISAGNDPELYTITLATTNPGPITIDDVDFNYTYVNTIGLDTVNDFFGMATGDDSIEIRSGVDIDLYAADDIWMEAGDNLQLRLVNRNDNNTNDGIQIRTETTSGSKMWTFRFDGHLQLPGGLTLPTKTNTGYETGYGLDGPTLQLSNDSQNQVIVTGPAATETYSSAQRIVIQGQRGYGSTSTQGEGGDVYIWGGVGGESNNNTNGWGHGGGSGGDVKLRGGQGINNYGGYAKIEGGNVAHFNTSTTGDAGFVEITGGDVTADNAAVDSRGGDVRITGGRAYTATTQSGVVQVITGGYVNGDVAGDKIWEFGNDGTLTLPNGGIISENGNTIRLEPNGVSSATQALLIYPTGEAGNHIHLTAGGGTTDLYLGNDSQYVKVDNSGTIVVGTLGANTSTWTFGTDGGLTFPDTTVQTTAWTGTVAYSNITDVPSVSTSTLVNGTSTLTLDSTGTVTVPGHIIPTTDVEYDLGSPTKRFRDIYLSDSTIYIGSGTISITETGQMLVNGNDAVSKLEYFGGQGDGPRDSESIDWTTSTITFNTPGKDLLTAIYDLKPGNIIRAINTQSGFDQEFTIISNAREYYRQVSEYSSSTYIAAEVDVAETTSTSTYIHQLYLPVKDKSATLANGTWSVTLSSIGALTFPDNTVQTTAWTGTLSVSSIDTLTFPDSTVQTTAWTGGISWSVTAANGKYVFSGPGIVSAIADAPVLYLYKGFTYTFVNTTGGSHPFAFKAQGQYGIGDYTSGITGSQTGTQIFTVPMNAPSTLYYECTIHSNMGNTINIV